MARSLRLSKAQRRRVIAGYLFISPWVLGFLAFTAFPMIFAAYISLTKWTGITPERFLGLANYGQLLRDPIFWSSLRVTVYYTFLSVPLNLAVGLGLALLLNQQIAARSWFRAAFYLPSIAPMVAVAAVWVTIFDANYGLLDTVLGWFGIQPIAWLGSEQWVIPALIIMSLWGVGGSMVIFLAGLQGIPTELYEAAEMDGASATAKFSSVTVPMLSPVILLNLIIGMINSFQVFTNAWIMTGGGPGDASHFLVLYIYQNAWEYLQMGYASALSWVLFGIILIFTILVFKLTSGSVYYAAAQEGKQQ
jgi:multiple sugar transport system permease protein